MSDLISRQAAIDAIRASTSKYTGFMEMEMYTDDDAVKAIKSVPSAEPVRHGKWIGYAGTIGNECSVCGKWLDVLQGTAEMNYCPNCGARMDAERKEE